MIKDIIESIEKQFDVLRLNDIKTISTGDDIDFLAHPQDADALALFLHEHKFVVRRPQDRAVIGYKFIDGVCYEFDFAYSYNPYLYFFPGVVLNEQFHKDMWKDLNLEKFIRYSLELRHTKAKYTKFIEDHFDDYRYLLTTTKYLDKPVCRSRVTRATLVRAMQRQPLALVRAFRLHALLRIVYAVVTRKIAKIGSGKLIAFVGADGAGKSTAIKKVEHIAAARTVQFADDTIVFNKLYALSDKLPAPIARLKYVTIYLEQWLRYIWFLFCKLRGQTILFDRWPGTNRHLRRNDAWNSINSLIYKIFPHPDIYIFLSADPTAIHSRKPELSVNEIQILQSNLRHNIMHTQHTEVVTEDMDSSLHQILYTVLKTQDRLNR